MKPCYIFGAGEPSFPTVLPNRDDVLVIAADGGYPLAVRVFGTPDLAVGDFDSLGAVPTDVPTLRHPAEKNDTDMALAAEAAIERGATELYIYAALGGRLDHTLANIQLLAALAERGIRATLFGADGVAVTALASGERAEFSKRTGIFSVFAHGGVANGVTLSGVKYPLASATLTPRCPLGISNEFVGSCATVTLSEGILVLFYSVQDGGMPTVYR